MARYREKPAVIEAVQFNGNNLERIVEFTGSTVYASMEWRIGDWILRDDKGKFYVCGSDLFDASFEAVDAQEPS